MKRYVSFLSILAVVFATSSVRASDCTGSDCDLEPIVLEEEWGVGFAQEDVLEPMEHSENLWVENPTDDDLDKEDEEDEEDDYTDLALIEIDSVEEQEVCEYDDNCPFDTPWECEVWYKKPAYKTSVAPRAPHLSPVKTDGILYTLLFQGDISANDALASPLLKRYQALMRASKQCCTEGIIHQLQENKAGDNNIYNFLKDDASGYGVTSRCLVMADHDLYDDYSYGVTGEMVANVRNLCVCKNRQWFDSLLEPFYDIYQMAPGFEYTPFFYTYLDGMQREMTVSVNEDVQNVINMLGNCPD